MELKGRGQNRKKRSGWWLVGILLVLLALVGGGAYVFRMHSQGNAEKPAETSKDIAQSAELTLDQKVDKIVAGMTPAEKIGQMMMIGIKGKDVNDDSLYMLHEYGMGGVILFDRNMDSKEQVAKLNSHLQQQAGQKVPLFIAVDEEGGDVVRMANDLTPPPAAKSLGAAGKPEAAREWAVRTSKELKAIGFNIDFAPVADVGSPDTRSYSTDPQVVTDFVRNAAEGFEQEGILYSLKHFPGLGRGRVDTHMDADRVQAGQQQLASVDFVPFQTMIQERNPENYFVMVSHLTYDALDSSSPASLSPKIITGILREQMGFKGLIITDDTEMGALSKHYDFLEIGVRAVQAGVDIVMVCHEYEHETAVYNGLLKALQSGELSTERVDASVKRIVRAKLLHLMK